MSHLGLRKRINKSKFSLVTLGGINKLMVFLKMYFI